MNVLQFTVPGKVSSNNRVTRFDGRGARKNPQAVSYQASVFQNAFVAVQKSGWKMPEACVVEIDLFNVRVDIDNAPKSILDGMSAVVYDDDKRVVKTIVTKFVDNDGERIVVRVSPTAPLVREKKQKAKERVA